MPATRPSSRSCAKSVSSSPSASGALLEEDEWRALPIMLRFFVLTEAGMADPDDALRRGWREYPDAERSAIRATLRAWIRDLDALSALTL